MKPLASEVAKIFEATVSDMVARNLAPGLAGEVTKNATHTGGHFVGSQVVRDASINTGAPGLKF
jgi:hypothetical protein